MLHLQHLDGVLDHRETGEVVGREKVGDVAVHEDFAGLEVEDGGFGDPRVGAAEPEDLRLLAGTEGGEEAWVRGGGAGGPGGVAVEEVARVRVGREGEDVYDTDTSETDRG